ncbi:MAG: GDP-mannose 4,6-dehydratase [Planctomycetes bacterium]|nr:GDP-mannose 4,6-dehydratase [Planctomycetota bacterium]
MTPPVLVTGAGGFCGSHLVESLLADGAAVRAFVRYNGRGDLGWLSAVRHPLLEVIAGDLEDQSAVVEAARGAEVVCHLGALVGIPYSYVHPEEVLRSNTFGTFNVLTAARAAGARRVVHVSTSEVYGTARYVPIDERHPLTGQSPYSASKIAADKVAESFHLAFGLPVVTVRPFNMYGPRQSPRAVIPTIISQLSRGPRLRLGALEPTRDFTFVADTVRAIRAAAAAPPETVVGKTINVGSGKEISVGDLARLIGEIMGVPPDIGREEVRLRPAGSEVERLLSDSSLAATLLGWRPLVGLRDGLARTIAFIRANPALYQDTAYRV